MKSGFETQKANDPSAGKSSFVPPAVAQMAKLFPQLEIIALLGQGGMGAVYKARQPRLDRFVALKILSPEKQNEPQFAERFEREARALASLTHPNIVTVYDFGEVLGMFYLLMEYVDGLTLRQLYQARKFSPAEALAIVPKICEALQYAHEHGIVHRDIKPENILIDKDGRVKIADFGIAKILDPDPKDLSLTDAREVIGTPHYMAPEQLEKPDSVDCRADIYSLGVVFYEMLTGELPLGKFPPPSQKVQIDVRLDQVVLHALEKEPDRRYQTANEVKTDVETITTTPPHIAPAPPASAAALAPAPMPLPVRPAGVSRIMLISAAIGVAACLALGCLALLFLSHSRKSSPPAMATAASPAITNISPDVLNDDQRVAQQYITHKYERFSDGRNFSGWSNEERAALENRLLDTLKGPRSDDYYRAINSLAALRSTAALPVLRKLAFDHTDKLLRVEVSNRPRWMAIRALGVMNDKADVPKLIHLLYHNNSYVRWSAQIALVQLTGRNFGNDWRAWGQWWNSQNGQPPFDSRPVRWWHGQADPDLLAETLAEDDLKFLENARNHIAPGTVAAVDTPDFSLSGSGYTIETLADGARAFSNRNYLWRDIPEKYRGWHYTRLEGGSHPQILLHVKRNTTIRIFTAADQPGVDLTGWQPTGIEFHYNDDKNTRLAVFQKSAAAGQDIAIPQGNWTGAAVLLPGPADREAGKNAYTPATVSRTKKTMNYTLRNLQNNNSVLNPTDADIRAMVASLHEDSDPVLALETDAEDFNQPLRMDEVSHGRYTFVCLDGKVPYFSKPGRSVSAEIAILIIISYRDGNDAWKRLTEWEKGKL
jgi:serine/threonine protein kinase